MLDDVSNESEEFGPCRTQTQSHTRHNLTRGTEQNTNQHNTNRTQHKTEQNTHPIVRILCTDLVVKRRAIDALAAAPVTVRVASLRHEAGNDAVKDQAVVVCSAVDGEMATR
jgi:hypothetical protein